MSPQTTFPFAPPEPDGAEGDGQEKGSRTLLVVLVSVGVAAVLALGSWFLFLSGGDEAEIAAQPVAPRRPAATAPKPAAQPAAPKAAEVPAASVAGGRNPFKTLLPPAPTQAPAPAGGTGTTTSTGGSSTGGSTSGSTGTVAPAPTSAPTTPVTKPALPASKTPITFKLVNVQKNNSSASMIVGGKTYTAEVGQRFATYFRVLRLQDGECGAFKYSTQSFYLCEGGSATMK